MIRRWFCGDGEDELRAGSGDTVGPEGEAIQLDKFFAETVPLFGGWHSGAVRGFEGEGGICDELGVAARGWGLRVADWSWRFRVWIA